jgi:hypothetical protein
MILVIRLSDIARAKSKEIPTSLPPYFQIDNSPAQDDCKLPTGVKSEKKPFVRPATVVEVATAKSAKSTFFTELPAESGGSLEQSYERRDDDDRCVHSDSSSSGSRQSQSHTAEEVLHVTKRDGTPTL